MSTDPNVLDLLNADLRRSDAIAATALTLADGDAVYRQGDACSDVYVIESGYVRFTHVDVDGAAIITAILNAGQLFGPGLGGEATAAQSVTAKGQDLLYRYSVTAFRDLIAREDQLAPRIIAMLARRQAIADRRLRAVLTLDVRGRIAVALRDLLGHYGGRCEHGHEIDVALTQEELAELVGASRPVVSSLLNDLRRQGLLSYTRGFICVNDLDVLDRLGRRQL